MKRPLAVGFVVITIFVAGMGVLAWNLVPRLRALYEIFGLPPYRVYQVGEKFPALARLKTVEGGVFDLSEHSYRVLLVNYFASG